MPSVAEDQLHMETPPHAAKIYDGCSMHKILAGPVYLLPMTEVRNITRFLVYSRDNDDSSDMVVDRKTSSGNNVENTDVNFRDASSGAPRNGGGWQMADSPIQQHQYLPGWEATGRLPATASADANQTKQVPRKISMELVEPVGQRVGSWERRGPQGEAPKDE